MQKKIFDEISPGQEFRWTPTGSIFKLEAFRKIHNTVEGFNAVRTDSNECLVFPQDAVVFVEGVKNS